MTIAQTASITIVIPAFNSGRTIERAVASCQEQSAAPREIVVVDDASTDDTSLRLRRLEKEDSRVRSIRLSRRNGGQRARLRGITESASEWIAFLDADDELLPDSLAIRLESLRAAPPDTALLYGDAYCDTPAGTLFQFKQLKGRSYNWLSKELSLCPYSCMMVRRSAFDAAGYPDADFPAWQDDDMALTIGKFFPVWHCGAPVAVMDSTTYGISGDPRRVAKGCRLMVKKYRRDIIDHHGVMRLMLWYARVLRAYLLAFCEDPPRDGRDKAFRARRFIPSRLLSLWVRWLTAYLGRHFDHIYA